MCWVRPAILHLCRITLFSISGVSYVIAFLLVEFFFSLLVLVSFLWLRRRQLGRYLGICTARRSWCFARTGSHPVLWRSSGGFRSCVCVCVLHLNGERVEFSASLEPGMVCHGIRFRRSLSTNLFLCVRGERWMGSRILSTGYIEPCFI
jgi:hypothetical protein